VWRWPFANVIPAGPVGIVSAAGTGLQEVSTLLGKNGVGITQGIGTGGRDLKKEVGGIMFLEGLKACRLTRRQSDCSGEQASG
jgi:FdrA protein